jgi:hypothetical protein
VDERRRFLACLPGGEKMVAICREIGISRKPVMNASVVTTTSGFAACRTGLECDTATSAFLQQIQLHDELAALSLQCTRGMAMSQLKKDTADSKKSGLYCRSAFNRRQRHSKAWLRYGKPPPAG